VLPEIDKHQPNTKKISQRIKTHVKKNLWVWISLTAFFLAVWRITGTGCTFHGVIGIPCPGCGLTRAISFALRGDWQNAFTLHPLFWLAPLVLAAAVLFLIFKPEKLSSDRMNLIWITLAILFLSVYIVRMILFFPNQDPMVFNQNALIPRVWRLITDLFAR
jgi:cytochrome bd-type quinol oxidase subunit 2